MPLPILRNKGASPTCCTIRRFLSTNSSHHCDQSATIFEDRKWNPTHIARLVKENKCFEIGGWAFSLIELEQAADLTGAIPGIEMHELAWPALITRP